MIERDICHDEENAMSVKSVEAEIEELLSRLTSDEKRVLLDALRERFKQEREELYSVWGKDKNGRV